ncbi:MAG: AmmeMemoRadiSam system radical SAM enzyme [Candidatus Woesearchaeota archaeon]
MSETILKEAMFYEKKPNNLVKCHLCPHNCVIPENKQGICGVRKNINGKLYSLVYGKAIAWHLDPIEKKPLFHFYPGNFIYSFATAGCNFSCKFCQNWDISQISKGKDAQIIGYEKNPEQIIKEAISMNAKSIAMTYNEPSIFYEYAYDVCVLAKKNNLKTVFVSNGYINKEPIDKIQPYLDAINIDLKSFSDEFYKKICGAKLQPVLDSIKYYHEKNIWVEITTLIIPEENDTDEELTKIAEFIASVDKNIPWHISRFHPDYLMTEKSFTSSTTLERAYKIGKKAGLKYIYIGNIPGNTYENTYCPKCKKLLIKRYGFQILENKIKNNKCFYCDEKISGYF